MHGEPSGRSSVVMQRDEPQHPEGSMEQGRKAVLWVLEGEQDPRLLTRWVKGFSHQN